jgi:hypothetical protein
LKYPDCKVTILRGPLTEEGAKEAMRLSAAIRGSKTKKGKRPDMEKGGHGYEKTQAGRRKVKKG